MSSLFPAFFLHGLGCCQVCEEGDQSLGEAVLNMGRGWWCQPRVQAALGSRIGTHKGFMYKSL